MSSESTIPNASEGVEVTHFPEVIFPAGNSDFRAVRNRCAQACRVFNSTPDDADPEERSQKWLDIVRPDRDRAEDAVLAVTHDQTFSNPALKAKTPFVKPPVFIDYGIRLHVGGSTFINRNCMIMDTPVADVVIGEGCNIGPNCCIVGVTHPVRLDERLQKHSIGQPVTIGDDVWIGANVTILGGVTIGYGAVIGACSLVKRDIPPLSVAYGIPARVVGSVNDIPPTLPGAIMVANTLAEAKALSNRLPLPLPLTGTGRKRRWCASAHSSSLPAATDAVASDSRSSRPLTSDSQTVTKCRGKEKEANQKDGGEGDGKEGAEEEERLLDFDLLELLGMDSDELDDDDGEDADERGPPFRKVARPPRRRFSVVSGSASHSTRPLHSGSSERPNVDHDRDKIVKALLQRWRRQQRRRRKKAWAPKVIALLAIVSTCMVLFFLLGLYLGAKRVSQSGAEPGSL